MVFQITENQLKINITWFSKQKVELRDYSIFCSTLGIFVTGTDEGQNSQISGFHKILGSSMASNSKVTITSIASN